MVMGFVLNVRCVQRFQAPPKTPKYASTRHFRSSHIGSCPLNFSDLPINLVSSRLYSSRASPTPAKSWHSRTRFIIAEVRQLRAWILSSKNNPEDDSGVTLCFGYDRLKASSGVQK